MADESLPLIPANSKPNKALEELEEQIKQLWEKDVDPATIDKDIFKNISGILTE